MEAVDVLYRVDRTDDALLVELRRQRQLDEDPVHIIIGVQLGNEREQVLLGDVLRDLPIIRCNPGFLSGLVLEPEVDRRRGILPHLHRDEPEPAELAHLLGHLAADPRRERRSLHQRRHGAGGYRSNSYSSVSV